MNDRPTNESIDPAGNDTSRASPLMPTGSVGWAVFAAVALVLLGLGYYLFWGSKATSSEAGPARAALTVSIARPARTTLPETLTASGVIAPWQEASIGTQIGSYQLVDVLVNVGDQVRKGQVLARLNPALLRAEEAELVARYEQAVVNSRRAQGLRASGGISEQEVLEFTTLAKTATALLAAKRLELRYTAVTAPDDGVITARTATLGAVVPAGQELFRMIRQNRLEWRGEFTASQLGAVERGQQVALSLPDGSRARARVRQAAPALETASRLAIVYADVINGSAARAGMYAKGEITVRQTPALIVPAECVVIRDGRSYVMVVGSSDKSAKVVLRGVTAGRRNMDSVEIVRGLAGTERLVRRGAAFLNDGDLVNVADAAKVRS